MNIELMNKLSNSSINGYYDPSIGLITVWFHNMDNESEDLVAYLQEDMTWDLRKVIEEKSTLYGDKEVVEIKHECLGKFENGSKFDDTVRSVLKQIFEHSEKSEDTYSYKLEMMKLILDNNDYNKVRN